MDFTTKQQVPLAEMIRLAQQQGQAKAVTSPLGIASTIIGSGVKGVEEGIKLSESMNKIMEAKEKRKKLASALEMAKTQPEYQQYSTETGGMLSTLEPEKQVESMLKLREQNRPSIPVDFDPLTGQYTNATTKEVYQTLPPKSAIRSMATGTANTPIDISNATKAEKDVAMALIEGRATPAQVASMRGNRREYYSQLVTSIDPKFDFTLYPERSRARIEFGMAGATGKRIMSFNTLGKHLMTAEDNINKMDNERFSDWNKIKNNILGRAGSTEIAIQKTLAPIIGVEAARSIGTGGSSALLSESERKEIASGLSNINSKDQLLAYVDTIVHLAAQNLDTSEQAWIVRFGDNVKPPIAFKDKTLIPLLKKHGRDPMTMEKIDMGTTNKTGNENVSNILAELQELRKINVKP